METHYFNVDHVSYESNQIGSFERYFVQENNGDTVAVLAVTDDGMIPLVEQYRIANHRWTLEIPAGHANNPSERPTDALCASRAGGRFRRHQALRSSPVL